MSSFADGVFETSTSTGLGNLTLAPVTGYNTFGSKFADGVSFGCTIAAVDVNGVRTGQVEYGFASMGSGGTVLIRATPTVNFAAGTKHVFQTELTASKMPTRTASGTLLANLNDEFEDLGTWDGADDLDFGSIEINAAAFTQGGLPLATQAYVNAQGFLTSAAADLLFSTPAEVASYVGAQGFLTAVAAAAAYSPLGHTHTASQITDLATAAVAFSNKTGLISQWTNNTGYLTSVTPGGSTTQVQFNNSGALGGSPNFTWDNALAQLNVSNTGTLPQIADTSEFILGVFQDLAYNDVAYKFFQPFVFGFRNTATGRTGADFFPGILFSGELAGGDYRTDGDGLELINYSATLSGGAVASYLIGLDAGVTLLNAAEATNVIAVRGYDFLQTGTVAGTFTNFAASNYGGDASQRNATVTTRYQFYGDDLGALTNSANKYYAWFDARGVVRWRDDALDGAGNEQAIGAIYNPRFAKYTPGAVNFERGIYGQWVANVYQIGTEVGAGGVPGDVLRGVKIIGASLVTPAALTVGSHAVTLTGALTRVGAHALTLTTTNTTGVTLPTTGTLATLAGAEAFSNKTGNISQWTNDSGYATSAAVAAAYLAGPGPLVANAIPRMSGTGGYTVKGYTSGTPTITDTGLVQVTDGAVGAPAYSFAGSTDMGFYRASSTEASLAIGGVQAYRFAAGAFIAQAGVAFIDLLSDSAIFRIGAGRDVLFGRDAANVFAWRNGATAQEVRPYGYYSSATSRAYGSIKTALAAVTLTGASTATGNIIPAGCFLVGIATTVTTTITGSGVTGYTIGDADADRWGAITGTAVGTDSDNTDATANPSGYNAAASAITLTATGGTFTGGVVQVVAFFLSTGAD